MTNGVNREISVIANGYSVAARGKSGRRSIDDGTVQGHADVEAGLEAAGFQYVTTLDVSPDTLARRRSPELTALQLDIPIADGEASALLLEDTDGVLGWRFPDSAPTSALRRGRGNYAVDHYTISPRSREKPDGRRNFITDWLIETVTEPVRVYVVRFLAKRTIEAAIAHVEGGMATGPVLVNGSDASAWRAGDLSAANVRLPLDRPARVLLLVHGTFSSTAGSYGALAGGPELSGYDLVLGYDHHTLAEDPQTNAEAILATLHSLDLRPGSEIDAIAFSRGGLVYRILVEQLAPKSPLKAHFRKAIFVGCTNAGTPLAEPENWKSLLDVYTNVLVAGTRIGMKLAGAAHVQPLVVMAIKTMGSFAQMLSQAAITERRVPGLAAMEPDGEVVAALNAVSLPDSFDTRYFTISTNYNPDPTAAGSLAGRATLAALNRIADRLHGVANDLVVPTASMSNFGAARTAEDSFSLPPGNQVYHTVYFADLQVQARIAQWLNAGSTPGVLASVFEVEHLPSNSRPSRMPRGVKPDFDGEGVGGGRPPRPWIPDGMAAPAPDSNQGSPRRGHAGIDYSLPANIRDEGGRRAGPAGIDWGNLRAPSSAGNEEFAEPQPDVTPSDSHESIATEDRYNDMAATDLGEPQSAARPSSETTERYLAAEMTPYPMLGRPANIYVTVSPDAIIVADHAATATTPSPATLSREKKLTLEIIPQLNCEVVGKASEEVDLHIDDEVVTKFRVRGLATGSAEVIVEARQGSSPVASFLLKPVFVDAYPAPLRAAATIASAAKEQPGRAVLRIYEFKANDSSVRLQFNLSCDDPQITELYPLTIDGSFSLGSYATGVLKQVEDAWNLSHTGGESKIYDSFMQRLVADAIYRTNSLIPEPMRRLLWKYRKAIDAIQVISSEPYIPWELMYLSDPDGEDKERQGFLAEWGLTRWLHDAPINRRRIPTDKGDLRYIIPEYADIRAALKGATEERAMLERTFPGIQPITATSLDVGQFLANDAGDCALLHFACHGRTQQNSVVASDLLMLSQTNAEGKPVPDPLTWQTVYANADFGNRGGPLVFVNACQTGQTGGGIAGAAGFATAFLRPQSKHGAAAFIGALWSVDDKLANDFARTVYQWLEKGETLSVAVKAAREACRTKNDFTWLAYSVYGGS